MLILSVSLRRILNVGRSQKSVGTVGIRPRYRPDLSQMFHLVNLYYISLAY